MPTPLLKSFLGSYLTRQYLLFSPPSSSHPRTAMDFTDEELRELAAFLARRLTPELQPTDSTDAPPEAFDDWERVLSEARAAGDLGKVIQAAARVLPRDPYLREACALVAPPPTRGQSLLAGGLMVGLAAVLVLISLAGFATTGVLAAIESAGPGTLALSVESAPAGRAPERSGNPPPTGGVAFEAVVPTAPNAAASSGDAGPDAVAPLVAPEFALGEAARVPRMEDGPSEGPLEPAGLDDEIDGRPCKVGGWVYAGTKQPSDVYVVPYAVHVRAAPPTKENNWNSRTRTRCWLRKGDVVRLAEPALQLPGGHYWVHVAPAGDADVAWVDTGR